MISFYRNILLKPRWFPLVLQNSGIRHLYTMSSLGIDDFILTKNQFLKKAPVNYDKFRNKMKEQCEGGETELVFTEDLKQMIHIAENTEEDLQLVEKMMIKFHGQTSVRFGLYCFGPVIMRMYHVLNKPNEALNVYYNPSLNGMFDQLTSHIIIMDLLFRNQMYEEIVELYKSTREKQLTFGKFPKSVTVPLYAALYKINTLESYNYMMELWKEMEYIGHEPIRRVVCLAAALALNQNNPQVALEILTLVPNHNFYHVRSIKVLCCCALGKVEDALIVLASVLTIDTPEKQKHTFPKDIVDVVKEQVQKLKRKDLIIEFSRIEKQLNEFQHILDKTLDESLCEETAIINPVDQKKNFIRAAFHDMPRIVKRSSVRPGLEDMI